MAKLTLDRLERWARESPTKINRANWNGPAPGLGQFEAQAQAGQEQTESSPEERTWECLWMKSST